MYHAIRQYAYALNKTLAKNLEPNGINIINALKGHTFDSKYSTEIHVALSGNLKYFEAPIMDYIVLSYTTSLIFCF